MTTRSCRCCSSSRLSLVLDLGSQPWGNDYIPMASGKTSVFHPLELYFCEDCTMVQIGHTIPKETMFVEHNYVSHTTRSLRDHFDMVGRNILERIDVAPNEYVLDIGGNDGTFLKPLAARGVGVLNVDSGRLQAKLSEEAGVPVINDFFNLELAKHILSTQGPARVIHGAGILFHLEELHSAFDGISLLLAENGFLVAEFIYLPEMMKQCAFDQIYHEHMVYYRLASFERLLAMHGMGIERVEFSPIHGGTAIAFIRRRTAGFETPAEVRALFAAEEAAGLGALPAYLDFAARARTLAAKLKSILVDFRRRGLVVDALGAPVKGSTIIHFSGVTAEDLRCAVEINRLKCDCWFPGTRIPVRHQDEMPPPDAYLLLSWNFKNEILAKLESYRAQGGKIIIPIPDPEVI